MKLKLGKPIDLDGRDDDSISDALREHINWDLRNELDTVLWVELSESLWSSFNSNLRAHIAWSHAA